MTAPWKKNFHNFINFNQNDCTLGKKLPRFYFFSAEMTAPSKKNFQNLLFLAEMTAPREKNFHNLVNFNLSSCILN